jgi:hypothetical protein
LRSRLFKPPALEKGTPAKRKASNQTRFLLLVLLAVVIVVIAGRTAGGGDLSPGSLAALLGLIRNLALARSNLFLALFQYNRIG